jgi:hypothetical protein
MLGKILCKLGWHRPLYNHRFNFVETYSGKTVYNAECRCGIRFMVDSLSGFGGFKVKRQ